MWSGIPRLAFVALLAINCVLWSHSRYSHVGTRSSLLSATHTKRALSDSDQLNAVLLNANQVRTFLYLVLSDLVLSGPG